MNKEQRNRPRRRRHRCCSCLPFLAVSCCWVLSSLSSTTMAFTPPRIHHDKQRTSLIFSTRLEEEVTYSTATTTESPKESLQRSSRSRDERVVAGVVKSTSPQRRVLSDTKPITAFTTTHGSNSTTSTPQPPIHTTPKNKNKKTKSRSSTMTSFAVQSQRQVAYAQRNAHSLQAETPAQQRRRHHTNSHRMYMNSKAVPHSMLQFATEIHQHDRITAAEEVQLGTQTQEAVRLQTIYAQLQDQRGRAPTDAEWCAAAGKINTEALAQAMEDGLEAKNRLVTSNLRMVQSVVNTYIRNGLGPRYNAGDLMQEGILALMRAAEKYEPDRGFKFSTYAMYWVRSSVKRSHVLQSRALPIPQRMYDRNQQLRRVEGELTRDWGRKPTTAELGAAVGITARQVESCWRVVDVRCSSLDQELINTKKPNNVSPTTRRVDCVADATSVTAEYKLLREDLLAALQKYLNQEQLELLLLRFGLTRSGDDEPHVGYHSLLANIILDPTEHGQLLTVAELSRRIGWKPWRVRKVIHSSLRTLKEAGFEELRVLAQELQ